MKLSHHLADGKSIQISGLNSSSSNLYVTETQFLEKSKGITLSHTLRRGIIHITCGAIVVILVFLLPRGTTLLLLSLPTLGFLSFDLLRFKLPPIRALFVALFLPFMRDYETSRLTGASFLLISSLVSITVFSQEIAILAISFLALGDPLSGISGQIFGRWNISKKIVSNVLGCILGCAVAGIIWHHIGLKMSLSMVSCGILAATVVESLPLPIDDNMTVPLISGAAMWLVQSIF